MARARLIAAAAAATLAVLLGVVAAWPIYQTPWLFVPAAAAVLLGVGGAAFAATRRWNALVTVLVLVGVFAVTVVPVAIPQAFERLPMGLVTGLRDGLAAVVLGWKQLLTLTLPVGSYQTMLVPAYLVFLMTAFLATTIALRAGRFAPLAAVPLLLPVAFGTFFGASSLSGSISLGPVTVAAPREIGLWIAAGLLGASWVAYTAGAERRAALRRGRAPGEKRVTGGAFARLGVASAMVLVGLGAALALAPTLTAGAREVARDSLQPELVVRQQVSPLASYRLWKRDGAIDTVAFTVQAEGGSPARLRLAVLDEYDGVDFHVGTAASGSFSRFPAGGQAADPAEVTVMIGEGYAGIWVPVAPLGATPSFTGSRASELADAFYVNRATGAAIAVPGGIGTAGLENGDGFRVTMSGAPDATLTGGPTPQSAPLALDAYPELAAWLKAQDQPGTADGLRELVERLRARGYLSHAMSDGEGERAWIERLSSRYGTRFESSAGGHSAARIEQLFAQLNTQQRIAGPDAAAAQLVAAVGDDEQFATAAALLARALGFESRVVVGVRLGGEAAGVPGVPACDATCTGDAMAAWVEVRGDAGEWAPIDVTPQVEVRPIALTQGEQLPQFPTIPEERDAREVDPPLGVGERSNEGGEAELGAAPSWVWPVVRAAGLSLAAVGFIALPLLFLPLVKRRTARARSAETVPELRVLNAWQEMVDRATDAGVCVPTGGGRREVAEALNTAPARWAAVQVDRAVFSPSGVSDADAEWVWEAARADRAEREAQFTRWQRVRARYSLRSFWAGLRGERGVGVGRG